MRLKDGLGEKGSRPRFARSTALSIPFTTPQLLNLEKGGAGPIHNSQTPLSDVVPVRAYRRETEVASNVYIYLTRACIRT